LESHLFVPGWKVQPWLQSVGPAQLAKTSDPFWVSRQNASKDTPKNKTTLSITFDIAFLLFDFPSWWRTTSTIEVSLTKQPRPMYHTFALLQAGGAVDTTTS